MGWLLYKTGRSYGDRRAELLLAVGMEGRETSVCATTSAYSGCKLSSFVTVTQPASYCFDDIIVALVLLGTLLDDGMSLGAMEDDVCLV